MSGGNEFSINPTTGQITLQTNTLTQAEYVVSQDFLWIYSDEKTSGFSNKVLYTRELIFACHTSIARRKYNMMIELLSKCVEQKMDAFINCVLCCDFSRWRWKLEMELTFPEEATPYWLSRWTVIWRNLCGWRQDRRRPTKQQLPSTRPIHLLIQCINSLLLMQTVW